MIQIIESQLNHVNRIINELEENIEVLRNWGLYRDRVVNYKCLHPDLDYSHLDGQGNDTGELDFSEQWMRSLKVIRDAWLIIKSNNITNPTIINSITIDFEREFGPGHEELMSIGTIAMLIN